MYRAPLREIQFVLHELVQDGKLTDCFADAGYSAELADNITEEAAKFAENALEPLNQSGDREGSKWSPEGVTTPAGFRQAYSEYVAAGWPQLAVPAELGGQGMPHLLTIAVEELMFAANMAFFLGTSLAHGAVGAISASASEEQKLLFLPRLVSGEWMGTMNLTEAQAGSDLALIRTRATPDGDRYRVTGQKIFITWGDHDCAENIVHLVLGRLPDAPEGTKGISLFLVPKRLPDENGKAGVANS